jgi:hypothetical protein
MMTLSKALKTANYTNLLRKRKPVASARRSAAR